MNRVFLLACCLLVSFAPERAMAQTSLVPFTADELYKVFALFTDPDVARAVANDAVRVDADGTLPDSVRGVTLTFDSLILLSLMSPELEQRVAAYRARLRGGTQVDPAEVQAWDRRRAELRRWLDAGAPRVSEGPSGPDS